MSLAVQASVHLTFTNDPEPPMRPTPLTLLTVAALLAACSKPAPAAGAPSPDAVAVDSTQAAADSVKPAGDSATTAKATAADTIQPTVDSAAKDSLAKP
jgi:hypothetical protein